MRRNDSGEIRVLRPQQPGRVGKLTWSVLHGQQCEVRTAQQAVELHVIVTKLLAPKYTV